MAFQKVMSPMVVASTQLRHVIVTAVSSRRGEVPGRRLGGGLVRD